MVKARIDTGHGEVLAEVEMELVGYGPSRTARAYISETGEEIELDEAGVVAALRAWDAR